MIKKITIDQLKPGVFIHDFDSGWHTENLFINQTLVKNVKTIDIIRSWGIKEVYIDTERGLDIDAAKTAREVRDETDKSLHELAKADPSSSYYIPLKEEIAIAENIKKEAASVIQRATANILAGEPLETEDAFQLIEKMGDSVTRNKDALILLTRIRQKDEYTLMHSISVGSLVLSFCYFAKIPHEMTLNLAVGALFHDIGKTRIPLEILNKPGKLTDSEFEEMKRHAEYSAEVMVNATNLPHEAFDMGLHHHERYDGTGYPDGLKGEEIGYGSQVAAICDVYDAITSARCYKGGMESILALRKLYEWSNYHFNKDLTYKFIRCIGVYPIGTCVRLESDLIGVVVGSTDNVLQPIVRVFYNDKKKSAVPVYDRDLFKIGDKVASYEDPGKWDLGKLKIFDDLPAGISLFT
ncbi:MAG: HD-GYP domain-containing protein [Desulfobulbaceae bacterium]|uniref:HD-GYP domain-containing protein n=1 Tax=Candidatus Desulfobia pelagia TaxID=2841692 RepID=A0A8J6NG59_9BACT|nr:HD-GYP domain-containing protein [Candidatus Desulfobia pelagia]